MVKWDSIINMVYLCNVDLRANFYVANRCPSSRGTLEASQLRVASSGCTC